MNQLHKVIVWDWCERFFWALAGIMVFLFALGFTYDEPQLEAADAPRIEQCSPVNKAQK